MTDRPLCSRCKRFLDDDRDLADVAADGINIALSIRAAAAHMEPFRPDVSEQLKLDAERIDGFVAAIEDMIERGD
jgi:hypothetical protein